MAILIGFFLGHCNSIWIPTVLIAIRKWDAEPEVLIPIVISPVKHMSRTRKNKIYLMEVKRICLLLFICFPPKMETMFSPFAFKLSYNHNTSVFVPLLSVSKPCHLPSCPWPALVSKPATLQDLSPYPASCYFTEVTELWGGRRILLEDSASPFNREF